MSLLSLYSTLPLDQTLASIWQTYLFGHIGNMSLGMAMPLHHLSQQRIAMKFCTEIRVPQMMNHTDFGDPDISL